MEVSCLAYISPQFDFPAPEVFEFPKHDLVTVQSCSVPFRESLPDQPERVPPPSVHNLIPFIRLHISERLGESF